MKTSISRFYRYIVFVDLTFLIEPFASASEKLRSFRSGGGSNPSHVLRRIVSADSQSWISDHGHAVKRPTVSQSGLTAPPGVRQHQLVK